MSDGNFHLLPGSDAPGFDPRNTIPGDRRVGSGTYDYTIGNFDVRSLWGGVPRYGQGTVLQNFNDPEFLTYLSQSAQGVEGVYDIANPANILQFPGNLRQNTSAANIDTNILENLSQNFGIPNYTQSLSPRTDLAAGTITQATTDGFDLLGTAKEFQELAEKWDTENVGAWERWIAGSTNPYTKVETPSFLESALDPLVNIAGIWFGVEALDDADKARDQAGKLARQARQDSITTAALASGADAAYLAQQAGGTATEVEEAEQIAQAETRQAFQNIG